MAITQEFDLNLIPSSAPVVVYVDQYDHGTGRLAASLYNGDTAYSPSTASVYIQATKPDGTFVVSSTGVSLSGNVVTADLTEVMTQVAGRARVQFVLTEPSGRTGTFVFFLQIQASALPNDSELSESDFSMVEEAIELIQDSVSQAAESAVEAAASASASTQKAEDSEAWAKGTRDGEPVPATDETYHNNAKYWAEQASSAAAGVRTWNGRSGSVLPVAGDYSASQITYGLSNVGDALDATAQKTDLTSIVATGSTNATGSTISSGKYFYLNGTLVKAKADIANGSSFTLNTNYEVVTAGGLNDLEGDVLWENGDSTFSSTSFTVDLTKYKIFKLITTEGTCECATSGAQASNLNSSVTNIWYSNGSSKLVGYVRFLILDITTSTLAIGACTSISDGSTNNGRNVPIKVIGYKRY